jgi:PIN domain nuclease of toxin-antitoxin system
VSYLLDTHVLLGWVNGADTLSRAQARAVATASAEAPLRVSDISLWEIATLAELGRIRLGLPLRDWLEAAVAPPLVERVGISPAIAAQVASLPAHFHRDPADRILVATALVLGATLVTSDRAIIGSRVVPTLR